MRDTLKIYDLKNGSLKSRLFVKDQWAFQPSCEEREASILRFDIQSPIVEQSAWTLFQNPPETIINEHFPEPGNLIKYVKGNQLWNHSLTNFNDEGFGQLHLYIVSLDVALRQRMWEATRAIYDRMNSPTPAQYVKS
jgi:hypothetical protein